MSVKQMAGMVLFAGVSFLAIKSSVAEPDGGATISTGIPKVSLTVPGVSTPEQKGKFLMDNKCQILWYFQSTYHELPKCYVYTKSGKCIESKAVIQHCA